VLWEWAAPVDIAAAELLVSELVTNGVQAARLTGGNPPVSLRLSAGNGLVLIEVWDGNSSPPKPAELEEDGIPHSTRRAAGACSSWKRSASDGAGTRRRTRRER
jgi:anti-sigma regulatory factor (Ser/Thr protein kinase)